MKCKRINIIIWLSLILIIMVPQTLCRAAVTGDIESDPIVMSTKQKVNTSFKKNGNVKYFRLIVKEMGTIKIKFASSELKKDATVTFFYDDNQVYKDELIIKYNRKSNETTGTLESTKLLQPGQYILRVNTSKVSKKVKFSFETSFDVYKSNDLEPNNSEENAQEMAISTKNKAPVYHMLLSGEPNSLDMIDQFRFHLQKEQKIQISATAKGTDRIRVLIKRKTDSGSETINTDATEQYFTYKNGKSVFNYKSKNPFAKGDYYIMVWLEEGQTKQVPYTIKVFY